MPPGGLFVYTPSTSTCAALRSYEPVQTWNNPAGIDGDLAAEAAADVGRDDPDLVLGQAHVSGHQREDRTDRVRGLGRHPDRELAVDLVEMRDAAARLDRRDVDARQVDVFLDR